MQAIDVRKGSDRDATQLPKWVHYADRLTLLLAGLSLAVAVHPFTVRIAAVHVSVRSWWRPAAAALVIGAARHILISRPTLALTLRSGWHRTTSRYPAAAAAIPVAIATRVAVLFVGYFAVLAIPFPPDAPLDWVRSNALWQLPQRWDAGWYLSIVRDGYQWNGNVATGQNLNFFPAYPLVVRIVTTVISSGHLPEEVATAWTAVAVSIFCFAAATIYFYRFVCERFGERVASNAVVLLAAYPFAVFYSAVYSEALFLLCSVAAWYHFERSETARSGLWGVLAGLCRPNGGLLSIALVTSMWTAGGRNRRVRYAAALCPMVGTALYSIYAYRVTGHPLVWAELQREAWGRTYVGLDQSIWTELIQMFRVGFVRYVSAWPWRFVNFAPTVFALAAVWPVTRRIGVAAGTFVLVSTLGPLLNGGLDSMGRYTATVFPIFAWLALAAGSDRSPLLACCFGIGQALAAVLFFTWRPIA